MDLKLKWRGNGPIFPPSSTFQDELRRVKKRLPHFILWAKQRNRHHQMLREFAGDNKLRQELIRKLIRFHWHEALIQSKSPLLDEKAYHNWFYEGNERKRQIKTMEQVAPSPNELWFTNQLVLMAMPEIVFLPSCDDTSMDETIDVFYWRALAGFYEPYWPFSLPNPAFKHDPTLKNADLSTAVASS